MARTLFDLGFRTSAFDRPQIGINLKDLLNKATSYIPSQATPAAAPAPVAPPQSSSTIPPHVMALGGVGILGALAAIIFGHK